MYAAVILYVFRNESSAKLYMHLLKKKMEGNHSFDFCWTRHGIILNCGLLFFRMRSINGRVTDKIWLLCLHRHFCNFSYCIKYSWIRPINDDYFKYSHFFQFHEKEKDLYSKNSRIVIFGSVERGISTSGCTFAWFYSCQCTVFVQSPCWVHSLNDFVWL